ncbi:hypothetical protein ACYFX5_14055 [Bremerella sp. T1]|uniref:hypothetical protein n=1 Tax=Bremerella sp. TYQ1 TaxID=3119568 RepID=UPI001CCFD6EA|nr:hypothetical protein [Bremerella volcania]UBM34181.1 hypothetical protein LA756_15995 [Bremerella volcania]
MPEKKEIASSTPSSKTQFGVLDLMLQILSVAYVCGLITLGRTTDYGTNFVELIARTSTVFVAVGFWGYWFSLTSTVFLLFVAFRSEETAPRLFLVTNLVIMLACFVLPWVMTADQMIAVGGTVVTGLLLFLPGWIFHRLVTGNSITTANLWTFGLALFSNVALLTTLALLWVFMSV